MSHVAIDTDLSMVVIQDRVEMGRGLSAVDAADLLRRYDEVCLRLKSAELGFAQIGGDARRREAELRTGPRADPRGRR